MNAKIKKSIAKYSPSSIEPKWPRTSLTSRRNTTRSRSRGAAVRGKREYDPTTIERRWQGIWERVGIYNTPREPKNKKYILDMYPYPSGATMHVGHLEGYVGTDILARYERMNGCSVLHPMGWDSFGLPAENYAINTGIHPQQSTSENIKTFKRQLISTGLSYDWDREINSSDPGYYKWNQWLFIQMFKKGLAYKKEADVNWCPSCETVLANEQVVDGKCERCEAAVISKKLSQWFLKITAYADRLIEGLDGIDWLGEVKVQQKNWIGKKEGIEIEYQVISDTTGPAAPSSRPTSSAGQPAGARRDALRSRHPSIKVFTTRPDTNFGATFIVIAPEHPQVEELTTKENKDPVSKYIESVKNKSVDERIAVGRKKTGVFTGSYAINQLNGEKMPIWMSDFVLARFGTGAVVGVPGHDLRDFEFAKEYGLPIKRVVVGEDEDTSEIIKPEQVQEEEGTMVNSGFLDGLDIHEATSKIMDYMEEKGYGKRVTTYHMHDWLISRQRYWGTPIPMIYCEQCAEEDKGEREDMPGWYSVSEQDLPVVLPIDVDFQPTGESPITRSKSFQENVVCPSCGGKAKREVDTMDGYVDSSWYFIRFADPKNIAEFASQEKIKEWLPVDVYVGGGHVVQHLLFARFFWKFLYDEGLVDKSLGDEPFLKLRAPGWILGPDSRKMSKRWSNVITPDDIIPKYGADTLRMYEMFMGPFDATKPWSLTGVEGMYRFVNRVWRLATEDPVVLESEGDSRRLYQTMHKTIKRVTQDLNNLSYNRAIAGLMEYVNYLQAVGNRQQGGPPSPRLRRVKCAEWDEATKTLLLLLAPFAPHITEELWHEVLGEKDSIHKTAWPSFDEVLTQEETIEIPVQVNGKVRGTITVDSDKCKVQSEVEPKALELDSVIRHVEGKKVAKVIFVPGRLINFVVNN